jgi:capsular polysaccharide biosynthesis protein
MDTFRRRWLLVVALVAAGTAAGLVAAAVVSATQATLYRAETTLIVQQAGTPLPGGPDTNGLIRTVRNLLATDIVSQVVVRNLALHETPARLRQNLKVVSDPSAVLKVQVDDSDQTKATQIAQELGVVFSQIVQDRFGHAAKPLQVVVFDPAHPVGKVSPRLGRDLGWGALLGALAGLLAANLLVTLRQGRPGLGRVPAGRPPVLGDLSTEGGLAAIADSLLASSDARPFQTVLVVGDADEQVAAELAETLAGRGQLAMWVRAADADAAELDRLTARCRFVLVSAPSLESPLEADVDAVVRVASRSELVALVAGPPGVRIVGTVIARENGEA